MQHKYRMLRGQQELERVRREESDKKKIADRIA